MHSTSFSRFLLILVGIFFLSNNIFAAGNSIVAVDKDGVTGQYTSLVLDANGFPTISYYDASEAKLKVAHCFEKNCALFNSIVTPDSTSNVGKYTALTLDVNGNPVVSYYDATNGDLKVLHCGNTACSTGNTIATVDSAGNVGQYTSVTVDNNNFPVVSYYDVTSGVLKVAHCGNAACTAGNSIVKPDLNSSNGAQSSIKINSNGLPVIAYSDFTNSALKLLTCGNANCTANNTIVTVDNAAAVGGYPSLVLDASGKPAISYLDVTNGKLKIVRCGNATCSAGNTIASAGTASNFVGYFTSLVLDASNKPVVSFWDRTNGDLNVLRCTNTSCSNNQIITVPDSQGTVGQYTSLKLDANSNPVISYYDATQGDLKVLHCSNNTCNPNTVTTPDPATNVGEYTSLKLNANKPVVSYWDSANGDLKVLACGNADCTVGNSITAPVVNGNTGWDTSLALDVNNNPVISFFDFTASSMKVLRCINTTCSGGANNVAQPDILSRRTTSIALDAAGNAVIASSGQPDQGLRIVHCGDASCAVNNTITSPDFPAFPFNADVRGVSMVLDGSGNPVVSFFREDKTQLKLLHCVDPACQGPGNGLTVLDPGVDASDHRSTSVTLDANGNPVMAYQDIAGKTLKLLHCGNANCTANNTITVVANGSSVGWEPAIKLDANGYPVISYGAPAGMTVVHCGDSNCTAQNTIAVIDAGVTGGDSSIAIDSSGNPVVSYYDSTTNKLKVVHCATASCL